MTVHVRIPFVEDADCTLYHGDALSVLRELPDESVHCVVTSPPYYGLRDYGVEGQIGLEESPFDYIDKLVAVFSEVRRVLRPDGTLWLNLGDTYASKARGSDAGWDKSRLTNPGRAQKAQAASLRRTGESHRGRNAGFKNKDLMLIPARVAMALQEEGWWLRADIIWAKPNAIPESVTDRPTSAHEHVFLLTRSARYTYDADGIRESASWERWGDQTVKKAQPGRASWIKPKTKNELPSGSPQRDRKTNGFNDRWNGPEVDLSLGRNARSVWTIPTQPFPAAHFAVMPPALAERCILAGCAAGGTVLDPFVGPGTTPLVARKLGRRSIGIDLNAEYLEMASRRLAQQSLLS